MQVDAHYSLLMIDGSFPNTFIYMHILSIFMQKIRLKSSPVTKIRSIKVAINVLLCSASTSVANYLFI